jgi:hypothetical protein
MIIAVPYLGVGLYFFTPRSGAMRAYFSPRAALQFGHYRGVVDLGVGLAVRTIGRPDTDGLWRNEFGGMEVGVEAGYRFAGYRSGWMFMLVLS